MSWDGKAFSSLLAEVNMLRGKLMGVISMFGFQEQDDSMLDAMSQEIVHSAKIEGHILDHDSVRSSVARQLGLAYDGLPVPDHYTEGIVQVMIDATQHYDMPLDAERLFNWHAALFPMGRSGMYKITVGAWRSEGGSMQVVSGAIGHEKVHYEAPDNKDVPAMMNEFLGWVNAADISMDPLVKAAAAHLWFVTIHPFDDGNGRLCRTITEMLLSRADQTRQRYYSLSSVFFSNRKEYYRQLEQAQKGALDITAWIDWFLRQLRAKRQNLSKPNGCFGKDTVRSHLMTASAGSSICCWMGLKASSLLLNGTRLTIALRIRPTAILMISFLRASL